MARNRRPGEAPTPPTRGPTETAFSLLLRARRFRIAAGADRVAANLVAHGAQLSPDAAAWVGSGTPPAETPALCLGPSAGTLGPRSFGFLNNAGGAGVVAALDLPAPLALPRSGRLGIIVPHRDALPDLLPLFVARDLPISWLISVGDGDASDAIDFLSQDPSTDALAIVLGEGTRASSLRASVGAKPSVVLGGDPVSRATARRAGTHVVDRIGEWLALGALLGAGVALDVPTELWVQGGGIDWLRREAARYAVDVPIVHLDERSASGLEAALAAAQPPRLVIVVGAGVVLPSEKADDEIRLVTADTRQPEQVSRLLKALGTELGRSAPTESAPIEPAPIDSELAARVRAEADEKLSDHDAKRLLKAWGLKVTRQGPTSTPTGAVKVARMFDLPVLLVRGDDERVAETIPEVRRIAALLLESQSEGAPSVMVRERFPDVPRARVRVTAERGVGLMMRVGDAVALLPLDAAEAQRLAQQSGARRAADQRIVAGVLALIGSAALAESAILDLELYTGAEPVILRASGSLRRM